ncbi:MAG: nitrogenase-stabilizing/protective protein NifW [Gammaproteobacteria bacterium]|nr:nitrogenase-stabilizing/protective protein NifW [Gammaproteobacteria bacterium]
MKATLEHFTQRLQALSAAEDFFAYFGVPFAPAVLHTSRLHILKRFHHYLRTQPAPPEGDDATLHAHGRALLARAYDDFVHSTPREEKVFAIFTVLDGCRISLAAVRGALPSQTPED